MVSQSLATAIVRIRLCQPLAIRFLRDASHFFEISQVAKTLLQWSSAKCFGSRVFWGAKNERIVCSVNGRNGIVN